MIIYTLSAINDLLRRMACTIMSCKCPLQPASLAEDNFLPLILSCHVCSKIFFPKSSDSGRGKGRFRGGEEINHKMQRPRSAITHSRDHTPQWLREGCRFWK
ncbi:hypothetical protein CEXT_79081 [Caerostris extrusa]|uniref:Uncharacterized protein n=1 Tax=Caerostris extrusa TaxID=172846 RepID=A0AAV4PPP9_CAEEX|nr:hypothetical protein CEXT_79081 [Caerostris extrusa]